eukprot:ANDGO_00130.mRNA.1 hypothetical protein
MDPRPRCFPVDFAVTSNVFGDTRPCLISVVSNGESGPVFWVFAEGIVAENKSVSRALETVAERLQINVKIASGYAEIGIDNDFLKSLWYAPESERIMMGFRNSDPSYASKVLSFQIHASRNVSDVLFRKRILAHVEQRMEAFKLDLIRSILELQAAQDFPAKAAVSKAQEKSVRFKSPERRVPLASPSVRNGTAVGKDGSFPPAVRTANVPAPADVPVYNDMHSEIRLEADATQDQLKDAAASVPPVAQVAEERPILDLESPEEATAVQSAGNVFGTQVVAGLVNESIRLASSDERGPILSNSDAEPLREIPVSVVPKKREFFTSLLYGYSQVANTGVLAPLALEPISEVTKASPLIPVSEIQLQTAPGQIKHVCGRPRVLGRKAAWCFVEDAAIVVALTCDLFSWDVFILECLELHDGEMIQKVCFSPDGCLMLVLSGACIRVLDTSTDSWRLLRALPWPSDFVLRSGISSAISFLSEEQVFVVVGFADGNLGYVCLEKEDETQGWSVSESYFTSNLHGRRIISTASFKGLVMVVIHEDGISIWDLANNSMFPCAIASDNLGKFVDAKAFRYDTAEGTRLFSIIKQISVSTQSPTMHLYAVIPDQQRAPCRGQYHCDGVAADGTLSGSFAFDACQKHMIVAFSKSDLTIKNIGTGGLSGYIRDQSDPVELVHFHPGASAFVSVSSTGRVIVYGKGMAATASTKM